MERKLIKIIQITPRRKEYIFECLECHKHFPIDQSGYGWGRGKFCSHSCYSKSKLEKPSWNKGLTKQIDKRLEYDRPTKFKKGHPFGKRFKKGHIPWCAGKKRLDIQEEKHFFWKGAKVGYIALHRWIYKHKGNPKKCKECGKEGNNRKIHWANIDHKYRRDIDDFIPLCVSCHKKYDLNLIKLV